MNSPNNQCCCHVLQCLKSHQKLQYYPLWLLNWTLDMKQLWPWAFDGNIPNSLVVTASLKEGEEFFPTLSFYVNHNRPLKLSSEKCPLVLAGGEKILILPVLLSSNFIHLFADRLTWIWFLCLLVQCSSPWSVGFRVWSLSLSLQWLLNNICFVQSTASDQVEDGRQLDSRSSLSRLAQWGTWDVWRHLFWEGIKSLAPVVFRHLNRVRNLS